MRKQLLILTASAALCAFTTFAAAQTPGGTTGVNQSSPQDSGASPSNPTANSSAPVTGAATDPNTVNSGKQASSSSSEHAGADTLEGCVVKEQTDYFLQPATGDRVHLSGAADLSSHVGHDVKVSGTNQSASASSAGTSGTMASSDRSSTSGTASKETQNNASGSIAGNAGSSNASGTGSAASSSTRDFMVTKVDMVSESCPADIQKKIDANKAH